MESPRARTGDIPEIVHEPAVTVVESMMTPFLYNRIFVPFASVEVPLTEDDNADIGALTTGGSEQVGGKPLVMQAKHVGG